MQIWLPENCCCDATSVRMTVHQSTRIFVQTSIDQVSSKINNKSKNTWHYLSGEYLNQSHSDHQQGSLLNLIFHKGLKKVSTYMENSFSFRISLNLFMKNFSLSAEVTNPRSGRQHKFHYTFKIEHTLLHQCKFQTQNLILLHSLINMNMDIPYDSLIVHAMCEPMQNC